MSYTSDFDIAQKSAHDDGSSVEHPSRPHSALLLDYSANAHPLRYQHSLEAYRGAQTPNTLELSANHTVNSQPKSTNPPILERLSLRLFSGYYLMFVAGWGDGVTGTLLPYFKTDYHLSDMTASLYFVGTTVGFILGTFTVEIVLGFFGRSTLLSRISMRTIPVPAPHGSMTPSVYLRCQARFLALIFGATLHTLFFLIMAFKGGFISSLVAYVISAYGRAFMSSTIYGYVATTPTKPMGYVLGAWSLGAVIAPLIVQTVVARGVAWTNFYYGSLALTAINITFIFIAFRPTVTEVIAEYKPLQTMISPTASNTSKRDSPHLSGDNKAEDSVSILDDNDSSSPSTLRRALKTPYQWAFSVFIWFYSGCETTTQGFIVTYLLAVRNADPSSVGYVASGFWGGMTISRVLWGICSKDFTFTKRKYLVQLGIAFALAMQITIFSVNSFAENGVAAALIGFAYGPVYPECSNMVIDVLDKEVHMISLALMGAFATFGSALYPFIAGTVSRYDGPRTISYFLLAQSGCVFILWCFFPATNPRKAAPRRGMP